MVKLLVNKIIIIKVVSILLQQKIRSSFYVLMQTFLPKDLEHCVLVIEYGLYLFTIKQVTKPFILSSWKTI